MREDQILFAPLWDQIIEAYYDDQDLIGAKEIFPYVFDIPSLRQHIASYLEQDFRETMFHNLGRTAPPVSGFHDQSAQYNYYRHEGGVSRSAIAASDVRFTEEFVLTREEAMLLDPVFRKAPEILQTIAVIQGALTDYLLKFESYAKQHEATINYDGPKLSPYIKRLGGIADGFSLIHDFGTAVAHSLRRDGWTSGAPITGMDIQRGVATAYKDGFFESRNGYGDVKHCPFRGVVAHIMSIVLEQPYPGSAIRVIEEETAPGALFVFTAARVQELMAEPELEYPTQRLILV